jgi:hypothetical protein
MNDMMKELVASQDIAWSGVIPLLLFMSLFLAVCVWTMKQPDTPMDLE